MGAPLTETLKNHPLWKGFPLKVWPFGNEDFKATSPLTAVGLFAPQWDENSFFVLSLSGGKPHWVGSPCADAQIQVGPKTSTPLHRDAFDVALENKITEVVQLRIEKNPTRPIAILFESSSAEQWQASGLEILVSENVRAAFYFSPQTVSELRSQRVRFFCSAFSQVTALFTESLTSQRWSHHVFEAQVERGGEFHLTTLAAAVGLGRTEVHVDLLASGARSSVSGIHLLNSNQLYDSRVSIRHLAPDTWSRQNFKCVIADRAQSVFGGQIRIDRDAQRVDAGQHHKALLISPTAKALAFPELEVQADDVKAAHGSSVGQMDPQQIFYLKSRGLSENDSVRLLGEAFVRDVVMKLSQPQLKKQGEQILSQILPQFIGGLEEKIRTES